MPRWQDTIRRARDDYSPEVYLALILLVIALVVGNQDSIDVDTKIPIDLLLVMIEIVFISYRAVLRRLDALGAGLAAENEGQQQPIIIPKAQHTDVVHTHLTRQLEGLLDRARDLRDHADCTLDKHEMYAELIGLTDVVKHLRSNYESASIVAISSTNIEDFAEEPLAEKYLTANKEAVRLGVTVRRLFILTSSDLKDRKLLAIIRAHDKALRPLKDPSRPHDPPDPRVKWTAAERLSPDDRIQDFALFADQALVVQQAAKFEFTEQSTKTKQMADTFKRLWSHSATRGVEDLMKTSRR